jgi:hypothetical protein
MSVSERAAAAVSKMDELRREMAERRALRHRHRMEIQARARDCVRRQGPAIAQAIKELDEVARRRKAAGGWGTQNIDHQKTHVLALGPQDERPAANPSPPYRPPGNPPAASHSPVPPPPPERPTPPAHKPPPAERPRRPPRPPVPDDEDDFSSHSWMTRR